MSDYAICHNDKTFILRGGRPNSSADIDSQDCTTIGGDVYWEYSCVGLHDGPAIVLAVKNARYEPDSDGESIFYGLEHDGFFWADDHTPIQEEIADFYNDLVMEVVKDDYASID